MPKMKSNSGAKKRFKLTGSGRVKRNSAYKRHNLTVKTRKQKRRLSKSSLVDKTQEHQIKAMLPYGR
jgi:large subunit ribosomal protein L35